MFSRRHYRSPIRVPRGHTGGAAGPGSFHDPRPGRSLRRRGHNGRTSTARPPSPGDTTAGPPAPGVSAETALERRRGSPPHRTRTATAARRPRTVRVRTQQWSASSFPSVSEVLDSRYRARVRFTRRPGLRGPAEGPSTGRRERSPPEAATGTVTATRIPRARPDTGTRRGRFVVAFGNPMPHGRVARKGREGRGHTTSGPGPIRGTRTGTSIPAVQPFSGAADRWGGPAGQAVRNRLLLYARDPTTHRDWL